MLEPAILRKESISRQFKEVFYSEEMMYVSGRDSWIPDINDDSQGVFAWAIVNKEDDLIGYFCYEIKRFESTVCNFCVISFDKGNPIIGKDVFEKMEELVENFHRVEWRMISGNPVERHYDKFLERHNGRKLVLWDKFRDLGGQLHNEIIYEIIKEPSKTSKPELVGLDYSVDDRYVYRCGVCDSLFSFFEKERPHRCSCCGAKLKWLSGDPGYVKEDNL